VTGHNLSVSVDVSCPDLKRKDASSERYLAGRPTIATHRLAVGGNTFSCCWLK
jgi:hypothetical protein